MIEKTDYFAVWRPALEPLRKALPRRISGACMSIMRHFIIDAQHSPTIHNGISLNRGQIFRGRHGISEETGLSSQTIKSCISNLRSLNEVASEATSRGTIYTIINYDIYDAMKEKVTSEVTNNQPAKQPTSNQQVTTYKEVKEVKEVDQSLTGQAPAAENPPPTPPGPDTGGVPRGTPEQTPKEPTPTVALTNRLIALGLPHEGPTFSWFGLISKTYGLEVCEKVVSEAELRGLSLSGFKNSPKDFKAYLTKTVQNLASGKAQVGENGKATSICSGCGKPSPPHPTRDGEFHCAPCKHSWRPV